MSKPSAQTDDNPEWTAEDFAKARSASLTEPAHVVSALVRKRGRPAGTNKADSKVSVSLRLDPDVVAAWRATGPGWQSRMNDALRQAVGA